MKTTTCKSPKAYFKECCKVLDKWGFIYELLPSGNLRAEPMDFSINDTIIQEIQQKGYFVLPKYSGLYPCLIITTERKEVGL